MKYIKWKCSECNKDEPCICLMPTDSHPSLCVDRINGNPVWEKMEELYVSTQDFKER